MNALLTPPVLRQVEANVLSLLAAQAAHLFPTKSLASPRAVGDAVQAFLGENLDRCFPADTIRHFENGFERRRGWFDTVREYWNRHA